MMLALIALLASALQSFELGRFFTLPEWMPTDVSSEDTPGSDPSEIGMGWYIGDGIITTRYERVTQHFKIFEEYRYRIWKYGELITDETRPAYEVTEQFDNQHWTTVDTNVFWFGGPDDYSAYINRETTFHSWDEFNREIYDEGIEWEDLWRYSAYADLVDTNIESHVGYIGRSPRMTPEILAGVNSTFEAIYERLYEASEGYSNSWDVAKYGPKEEEHFRFDYPYYVGGKDNVFVYCPSLLPTNMTEEATNRVIKSRRFVDYNNIARAADWMTEEFLGNGARTTIVRPHWMGDYDEDTNIIENTSHLWWSTTHQSLPQRFMPELVNEEKPTKTNFWADALVTFNGLGDDGVWPGDDPAYYDDNFPGCELMVNLNWGNYDDFWDVLDCKWNGKTTDSLTNVTMRKLIEFAYPHADGWAITNTTRRLFFDRLCCLNQVLGLMDRTYQIPTVSYYGIYSNEHYWTQASATGHVSDVQAIWDDDAKVFYLEDIDSFSWGGFSNPTNGVSASGRKGTIEDCSRYLVTKPTTTSNLGFSVDPKPGTQYPNYDDDSFVYQAVSYFKTMYPSRFMDGDFKMEVRFDGTLNANNSFWANFTWEQQGVPFTTMHHGILPIIPSAMDAFDLSSRMTYNRSYNYDRIDPTAVIVGKVQKPETDKTFVGCIVTEHERRDWTNDVSEAMDYSSVTSKTFYTSFQYPYNSIVSMSNNINAAFLSVKSKLISDYGCNPTSWDQIIPITQSGASSVASGVKILNPSLRFYPVGNNSYYYIEGTIFGGEFTCINRAYTYYDIGEETRLIERIVPTINLVLNDGEVKRGKDTSPNKEGISMNGKMGVITKKDWEWKVLNRNP